MPNISSHHLECLVAYLNSHADWHTHLDFHADQHTYPNLHADWHTHLDFHTDWYPYPNFDIYAGSKSC